MRGKQCGPLDWQALTQFYSLDLLVDGQNSIRLLTSEEIPEGSYTGVRLIFDNEQDATVTRF